MKPMQHAAPSAWVMECHHQLDELFLAHQEALLLLELESAAALLGHYMECLVAHMQFEEERLFPAYRRGAPQGRWPVSLYQQEHRKILILLAGCQTDLKRLLLQPHASTHLHRGAILLLDRERTVKELAEHHHHREEVFMLPILEPGWPDTTDNEAIARVRVRWNLLLQGSAAVRHAAWAGTAARELFPTHARQG